MGGGEENIIGTVKPFTYIFLIILTLSCNTLKPKESVNQPKKTVSNETQVDFLELFKATESNTTIIDINEEWVNSGFYPDKMISSSHQHHFSRLTKYGCNEHSKFAPLDRIELKPNLFLLVVGEQYDYGVRCIGLTYNSLQDTVIDDLLLSSTFGDLDVSQTLKSTIVNDRITQIKSICIDEVNRKVDPPILINSDCKEEKKLFTILGDLTIQTYDLKGTKWNSRFFHYCNYYEFETDSTGFSEDGQVARSCPIDTVALEIPGDTILYMNHETFSYKISDSTLTINYDKWKINDSLHQRVFYYSKEYGEWISEYQYAYGREYLSRGNRILSF